MSDIVWINLVDYTPAQIAVFFTGCALWLVAYGIYIRQIAKYKYVEMPVFAGCCDVGWEFVWSFLIVTDMGMLVRIAYYGWFLLDLGYIYTLGVLRYGWKQLATPQLQRRSLYIPACLFISVLAAGATYFMYQQGLDNNAGGRSAYLIQLTISFLYVPLMLRQSSLQHFSYLAGWLRSLGSALVVVFFYMRFPDDYFLCFIGTVAAIVDGSYLYLFTKRRRALREGEELLSSTMVTAA